MNISTNSYYPQPNPPNRKKRIAKATWPGTFTFIFGLVVAFIRINVAMSPSLMASQVAIIVGVAIAVSILFDSRRGWNNLCRDDLLCI